MTRHALARYVLQEIQQLLGLAKPRILFVSPPQVDYMSTILYGALLPELGDDFASFVRKDGVHQGTSSNAPMALEYDVLNFSMIALRMTRNDSKQC